MGEGMRWAALAGTAAIMAVLYFAAQLALQPRQNITALVTKVLDGDTIIIEGGQSIRLLGIDAAERGEPCYDAAKGRLEQLVLGKNISLEADSRDRDKYSRLLRWVWHDGALINEQLVAEGLAIARAGDAKKYVTRIAAAEAAAIANRTGCEWQSR